MDSVTHVVLGAALGEVTLGKKIGYKAAIIGAIADTVPDFDVFLNFFTDDEILKLQIHRSYTHAFFLQFLVALPLAWATYLIFGKRITYKEWYLLWILGLTTHVLLDSGTTYGTQLLLPFTHMLVGWNYISVVDIFFTLPFMALIIGCLCMKKENPRRLRMAWMGLGYAITYLAFCAFNKYTVQQQFAKELQRQSIKHEQLYTTPAFFGNFLWSGIATTADTIWLGEYSILQERDEIKWVGYARHTSLIENHPDKRSADVLQWFAQGKYFVEQEADTLKFYNVKWGRGDFRETAPDKAFGFHFRIYPDGNSYKVVNIQPHFTGAEFKSAIKALFRRMGTADNW